MSVSATDKEISIEEFGKRTFLRPHQRQDLERSIDSIKNRLQNPVLLEMTGANVPDLQKQLAKEEQMLERGTPPDYDGPTMAKIARKYDKATDLIINGLPTHTMMERARPSDVDHFVAHENARHSDREDGNYTTKRAILARQNYLLTLDRNNVEPNFLSVATLRTDTVRGDPAKFRANFDFIQWREVVEEDLAGEIDDETYLAFVGCKALGWAEANIRRKFDWSQQMYDAVMVRWRGETANGSGDQNDNPIPYATPSDDDDDDTTSDPPSSLAMRNAGILLEMMEESELSKKDLAELLGLKPIVVSNRFARWGWKPEEFEAAKQVLQELSDNAALEPASVGEPGADSDVEPE